MPSKAKVFLHGDLAERYGSEFDFEANSVAEVVRLLEANFPGFAAALGEHKHGYVLINGQEATDIDALREAHLSPEIHIVPSVEGAGGGNSRVGIFQLVLAAALFAAGAYGGFSTATTNMLYASALNMAINGVATLLFSSQAKEGAIQDELSAVELASYAFNGPVNTTRQGNPVPILYGRLRVGSQVISAGVNTA